MYTDTTLDLRSTHDLRRAFGLRWARRVMPMVLKELMRHKTVLTTEKYYVGIQAQETAKHLKDVMAKEMELKSSLKESLVDTSVDT